MTPNRRGHMASYIARRKFLATLGGAAPWPLAARAQQPAMPVVGFLHDSWPEPRAIDGRNVRIDTRWGAGDADRTCRYAAELVAPAQDCRGLHQANPGNCDKDPGRK